MEIISEIKKLSSLLKDGAITQEEFDALKKNIISSQYEPKIFHAKKTGKIAFPSKEKVFIDEDIRNTNIDQIKRERNTGWSSVIIKLALLISLSAVFIPVIVNIVDNLSADPLSHSSSSSSSPSSEQAQSVEQKYGVYLINHTFTNHEMGGTTTLSFSPERGGAWGAMTMSMGTCDYVYGYILNGRQIDLKFTGSTCNAQGSSQSMFFNYDNTISVMVNGQRFVFAPL